MKRIILGNQSKFATRNGRGLSQPNESAEEDGECIHSGRAIRRNLLCQGDPERKNEKKTQTNARFLGRL